MSDNKIAWRRASRGILFLGLGTFLLLTTQGVLPWSFWGRALSFWPVLLVGFGIRLIFEKTRAPGLILLSPLLILGTLTYAAYYREPHRARDWASVATERPVSTERWTLAGELGMANLNLKAKEMDRNHLIEGRVSPGERHQLRLDRRGKHARVLLGMDEYRWSNIKINLPTRDNDWDLALSRDLPLSVDLHLACAGGEMSLTPIPVERMEIEGAFNDLKLKLGAPEKDTRLMFHGAFNQLEIIVPEDTPVRVSRDGFLNLVDGRSRSAKRGGPIYRVRIEGAFNRLAIRSE